MFDAERLGPDPMSRAGGLQAVRQLPGRHKGDREPLSEPTQIGPGLEPGGRVPWALRVSSGRMPEAFQFSDIVGSTSGPSPQIF
jgi:hypothetical protein